MPFASSFVIFGWRYASVVATSSNLGSGRPSLKESHVSLLLNQALKFIVGPSMPPNDMSVRHRRVRDSFVGLKVE